MISKFQNRAAQRGITLFGMLFVSVIVGGGFIVGAQVFPTVVEYLAVQKAVKKAATDGGSVAEVRANFDRSSQIDMISSLKGADLDITKEGERIVVSFAYNREIHLAGPANLLLKYQGKSK